jgi:hypothetical protein
VKSPYQTALACVRARTSDTASIARKTGIHECLIYALWIRERDRAYRRTKAEIREQIHDVVQTGVASGAI